MKKVRVLLIVFALFLGSFFYNFISGNRVPVVGHFIDFIRPALNNYKVVDLKSVVNNQNELFFGELPEKVKNTLIDYKEDVNRPDSEKKYDYSIPYINLSDKYNLSFEKSNYIYSDYFLFYTYGANYRAIFINDLYYLNISNFYTPVFYDDYIYICDNDFWDSTTNDSKKYYVISIKELMNW